MICEEVHWVNELSMDWFFRIARSLTQHPSITLFFPVANTCSKSSVILLTLRSYLPAGLDGP